MSNYSQIPTAQPRKRRVWPWILLGAFIVVFGGFAACAAVVGSVATNISNESKREVHVSYSVSGTGTASITYDTTTNAGWSSEQANDAKLPWSKDVTMSGILKSPNVFATLGPNGGKITCTITVDGQVLKTATGSGPYATAMCTASIPGGN
jgi:hypothetical protein